jgi:hypothetical protein
MLVTLLAGCGGSSSTPDALVPDAAVPDAAPAADAGPCNTITNVATDVPQMAVAEAAPTPSGGTIADGTYVVTASTIYTGAGGQAGATGAISHATSINTGGHYDYIDSGGGQVTVTSGGYTTSGIDDILVVQQCPPAGALTFHKYSASPTEFTLFDTSNPAAVQALTFTMP